MKTGTPTTVEISYDGPTKICRVRGAIEAWNCAEVVRQIDPQGGERMLVDIAGVREVDSTGLGALIDIYQQVLHRGARLAYTNPSPSVKRLLETTRLCRYFTILDDPDSIESFKLAE